MLYGREYGGSPRCSHCDSRTWTTCSECYRCGAPRCNDCAATIEDRDDSNGYRGEELICEACAAGQVAEIVCAECSGTLSELLAYREDYPTAVCCGKPGILVAREERSSTGQTNAA